MVKTAAKNNKIEIIRCLCILMVIYIHNASEVPSSISCDTPKWFDSMVYIISGIIGRVAVPCMFMISGYLLAKKEIGLFENIKKKTRSILVPYFLWNTIWILIYAVAIKIGILNHTGKNVLEYSVVEIIDCYTGHITGAPFVYPLWFLRDLYFMQCIFPLLYRYFKTKIWDCVVFAAGLMYFLGFPIEQWLMFALGIWIYYHKNAMEKIKEIPKIIIFALFSGGAWLEIQLPILDSAWRAISVLAGMLIIYWIAAFSENRFLKRLVKIAPYTMFIYCGHQYTLLLIRQVCAKLFTQSIMVRTTEYIAIPPLLFLGLLLLGRWMNKHIKRVYLALSGGR